MRTLQVAHRGRCERAASVRKALEAGVLRQAALVQILALDQGHLEPAGDGRCLEACQQAQAGRSSAYADDVVDIECLCGARGKPPLRLQADPERPSQRQSPGRSQRHSRRHQGPWGGCWGMRKYSRFTGGQRWHGGGMAGWCGAFADRR